jgi:hypothetical protein
MQQYLFDLLYLTWAATVGRLVVGGSAGYIYLLAPAYVMHLAWKWLVRPAINNMRISLGGQQQQQQPAALSKRQQKMQAKPQQRIKYVR